MLKVAILCVSMQMSNFSFTPSLPIGQRRVLVSKATVVQIEDSTAHYVSPFANASNLNIRGGNFNISGGNITIITEKKEKKKKLNHNSRRFSE